MKRKLLPIIAVVMIIAAVGVFMYPTISQWINKMYAESQITLYNDTVDTLPAEEKTHLLEQAEEYNRGLTQPVSDGFSCESFRADEEYYAILNVTENGQIGTVNISSIDCHLPIYHSDEDMLKRGAVHVAGTAFPIGGNSTHSVISAHTAYPGKIFFDRLTDLEIGDMFSVTVLGDTLYYRIISIDVVIPSDTEHLAIEKGRDLVTLVTCTPYSINTHRLLVTGERIEAPKEQTSTADEATLDEPVSRMKPYYLIPIIIAADIVIAAVVLVLMKRCGKRRLKHAK